MTVDNTKTTQKEKKTVTTVTKYLSTQSQTQAMNIDCTDLQNALLSHALYLNE